MRLCQTLLVLLPICCGCSQPLEPTQPPPRSADTIDRAIAESRFDDALRLARVALLQSPNDPNTLADAARATAASGDRREAAVLLAESARAARFTPGARAELAMRAFIEVGDVYSAIDLLSDAVDLKPNPRLRRLLFGLLGEVGRTDLIDRHYQHIVRSRTFDAATLVIGTDSSQRLFSSDAIETLIKRNPNDYRLRFTRALSTRDEHNLEQTEVLLREILSHHKDFAPAHALLGRLPSVQNGSDEDFQAWRDAARPHCAQQPDYWIALGDRHYQLQNLSQAIFCYRSASQYNPNEVCAWSQTARCLELISAESASTVLSRSTAKQLAIACQQRAQELLELRMHLQRFGGRDQKSQRAATDVARSLSKLGRLWEAEAWTAIATTLTDDPDPQLDSLRQRIVETLSRQRDWISLPDTSPLNVFTNNDAMLVDDRNAAPQRVSASGTGVCFVDETASRGLAAEKKDYPDIHSSLIHTLGTGGGTIDYDRDGFPDLAFASFDGLKVDEPARQTSMNALYRNLGEAFRDISRFANINFGSGAQGITIGDYNEDGFQDIFVACVGANRLLRNNGDGTFTNAPESLPSQTHHWTTGGAFADLNKDGITDLVVINYCKLDSGVDLPCKTPTGPAPCHPARFPADRDQLYLSDGTGGFKQTNLVASAPITPGRGLGILAGSLTEDQQSVYVANDMSANHLLQLKPNGLFDHAIPLGVAVDGQAFAQASMGIAASDFDGDNDLDLYVTGFAREYNIYYEQIDGYWVDNTSSQGLIDETLMTVGFGTQAIDADGDGIDELAITNGHIGDFGPDQPPLKQPFQLMRRSTDGSFVAADISHPGRYLASDHVGRSLWKIDVNRDLADDLVVTHQDSQPVLLVNQTQSNHRRVALQCIGTKSSRDAIGATIRFSVDGRQRTMWLLSGDGYMCSNEQILKAGLGHNDHADDVSVTWPDGTTESFGSINAGQTCLLIEGTGEAFAAR